ncbi:MAG: 6-pyruvoyl-tetrahydropterin synthase-related protein, partial [bacterium]|nr:6-pyruvoyl-tetrahydropterin synthase-related protein [bacterium]
MQKLISKYWPFILIVVLSLSVSWPLVKSGYFSHQDDLQVIRIFEMRKCFADMQIPCRWVPDMGWGNGFPLFNFYGVFPYYLGAVLSYFVGYIGAAKLLFFIALSAGSFGVYLLIKSLWGKSAGITSAVLYLFAPYKALDVYVRGALSESMALAIIPFVFYFVYKLITSSEKKFSILFSLSLFLFLITHNIMTIIFLPVLFGWLFYWLVI